MGKKSINHSNYPNLPHYLIFISYIIFTLTSFYCFYGWESELIHLRFYRWIGAICGGSLTALAGHCLQRVFQNPLAEGYVLGITGVSNVTHALFLVFGIGFFSFNADNTYINGNLNGNFISLFIVSIYGLWLFKQKTEHILLIGIWVGQISGAIITLCFVMLPDLLQKSLLFWWFGDLELYEFPVLLAAVCPILIGYFIYSSLNAKSHILYYDKKWLETLNLNITLQKVQNKHLWLALIATTIVTTTLGSLPMIGMMLPLFLLNIQKRFNLQKKQKLSETQLRILMVIWGALWLMIADEIGLKLFNPHNIPIGVLTLLSGLFLLFLGFYINKRKIANNH